MISFLKRLLLSPLPSSPEPTAITEGSPQREGFTHSLQDVVLPSRVMLNATVDGVPRIESFATGSVYVAVSWTFFRITDRKDAKGRTITSYDTLGVWSLGEPFHLAHENAVILISERPYRLWGKQTDCYGTPLDKGLPDEIVRWLAQVETLRQSEISVANAGKSSEQIQVREIGVHSGDRVQLEAHIELVRRGHEDPYRTTPQENRDLYRTRSDLGAVVIRLLDA